MRSFLKICAAVFVLTCGVALTERANAMPLAPLSTAAGQAGAIEQVQYGCRRVWRCGPYGCGWRRICWAPPVPYYGAYGFRPYYGYGYGYRRWGYGPRWGGYRRW